MATQDDTESDHLYDIKTVSHLTGLTSANIRAWEKRYQVVTPTRSDTGRRQYSRRDLKRLTLLKALIDLGHSISSSAPLPLEELERRVADSTRSSMKLVKEPVENSNPHTCRICVVGTHLNALLEKGQAIPQNTTKIAGFTDIDDAEKAKLSGKVDLLMIECPALFIDDLERIQKLIASSGALRAIVVYVYTQERTYRSLSEANSQITGIKAPVTSKELSAACASDIALSNRSARAVLDSAAEPTPPTDQLPERNFSDIQLAEIAEQSTTIACECPYQMVSLLTSLNAFEQYSLSCENRNEADAQIHGYLHKMTAHARSTVEQALEVLVEFEGIETEKA